MATLGGGTGGNTGPSGTRCGTGGLAGAGRTSPGDDVMGLATVPLPEPGMALVNEEPCTPSPAFATTDSTLELLEPELLLADRR